MFSYQFKTSMMLILLGFISGVCMCVLLYACSGCGGSKAKTTTTENIKSKAKSFDSTYRSKAAALDTLKNSLQIKAAVNKKTLATVKTKVQSSEKHIRGLLQPDGFPVRNLLQKVGRPMPDSVFTFCDSLKNEIGIFLTENNVKDSLYERQINTLDSVVLTQDAIIQNDSLAYARLQGLFTEAVDYSTALEKDKLMLQKQMLRQKVRSKIVSFGLMVLTGITTNYLLRH